MDKRVGYGHYHYCGNLVSVGRVPVFELRWYRWRLGEGLGPGSKRVVWCYVCVSYESGVCV